VTGYGDLKNIFAAYTSGTQAATTGYNVPGYGDLNTIFAKYNYTPDSSLLFRFSPTSSGNTLAFTGQTITLNGNMIMNQVGGKWALSINSTPSSSNYATYNLGVTFPTSAFTVCCWLYIVGFTSIADWFSFNNTSLTTNNPVVGIRPRVFNSTLVGIIYSGGIQNFLGGPIPSLNTWYHCAFTYNNSSRVYNFYINGSFYNSGTLTTSISQTINAYYLLGNPLNSGICNGSGTDFRLYNRILTATEINNVYNNTI
jgi:hypothetical protein